MVIMRKVLLAILGYLSLFKGVKGFVNDPKCGENGYRNPKIVGGVAAGEAEFPWYVSIKEGGVHSCSGFIISRLAILSAAHCFQDFSKRALESPKTISVTLGHHNSKRFRRKSDEDMRVKRIIRHSGYDTFDESAKNDIALLILETEIQWNFWVKPVCLPVQSLLNNSSAMDLTIGQAMETDFHNGEIAVVAGYGSVDYTDANNNNEENTFQKVHLTMYDDEECRRILREKNVKIKTDIDSSVICAGSDNLGFDSCSGDSGTALLKKLRGLKGNSVWVAIGITSSGIGKCGNAIPGYYSRIRSHLQFINDSVSNYSSRVTN